ARVVQVREELEEERAQAREIRAQEEPRKEVNDGVMMAVRRTLGIAACVAIGALSACIGGRSDEQANKEPPAEVKQYILDAVPSDLTELNINFDDKVHLVGVRIEPSGPVQPGKKVKLTYYWRVDKPLDAG